MLEDLPSWCAPRSTYLRFWCTYLDVNCWWLMSRNFAVFFSLFEWNNPINHRLPLDINLNFFMPNPKSKSNLLWFCGQYSDFHSANNVIKRISPPLRYKLSKVQKTLSFVCLIHHQTFTSMSNIYLTYLHILYDQINSWNISDIQKVINLWRDFRDTQNTVQYKYL